MSDDVKISFRSMLFPSRQDMSSAGKDILYTNHKSKYFRQAAFPLEAIDGSPSHIFNNYEFPAESAGRWPYGERAELYNGPDYRVLLTQRTTEPLAFLHMEGKPKALRAFSVLLEDEASRTMLVRAAHRPTPRAADATAFHGCLGSAHDRLQSRQFFHMFGLDHEVLLAPFADIHRSIDAAAPVHELQIHALIQGEMLVLMLYDPIPVHGVSAHGVSEFCLIAMLPLGSR